MSFDRKSHWENVYANKKPQEVSWYQTETAVSLELITQNAMDHTAKIIDIGGGASVLVDKLLAEGFRYLTVLDISSKALEYAKERLAGSACAVKWIEADVTEFEIPEKYDIWHDRAVFHFLTSEDDRKKYMQNLNKALNPGGHVIIAEFSIDGPLKCSGLNVRRYSPDKLKNELGDHFEFVRSVNEVHRTPFNTEQKFTYCCFRKLA